MGRYATLKKEFEFLSKIYGFKISLKQKHGAYYYIVWSNPNKNIMILYDEQVDVPLSIRIYDSDSFSFDAVEYKNEFEQRSGSPREKIRRAAEWLSNAVANKYIIV
ncbi:MAG: hypothetical protein IKJ59_06575 [Clostridia bacterium]|nr:hypothetical protein [Clostridia bacterium]